MSRRVAASRWMPAMVAAAGWLWAGGCVGPGPGTPGVLYDAAGNPVSTEAIALVLSDPSLATDDARLQQLGELGLSSVQAQYCIDNNVGDDESVFDSASAPTLTEPEVTIVNASTLLATVTLQGINTATSYDKTWRLRTGESIVESVPAGRYYYEAKSSSGTVIVSGRATLKAGFAYQWTVVTQ